MTVIRTAEEITYQRGCIECIGFQQIPVFTEMKDAFEFREDRPAHWLQRLCLWTLRKLGCHASLETVKIERHVIGRKGERFTDAILRQADNLLDFNRQPARLLIGAEDYAKLMGEPTFETGFNFHTEYNIGNGRGRRPTVCGLTVEVIPWMRGMLVMP